MGAYRAPVMGLRCVGFVAFVSAATLVDCGGTVIRRGPEPRDDASAGAGSGSGGAAAGGGGRSSPFGGRPSGGSSSGGRSGIADASIGGSSSGGAADTSGGSSSTDAGRCNCPFGYSCLSTPRGTECVLACPDDTQDVCDSRCTNFERDVVNCGACKMDCTYRAQEATCEDGKCRTIACELGYGDCSDAPGCETSLDEPENCGACGNKICRYEHAETGCTIEAGCSAPTCDAGWANCDKTTPDCETQLGANGATCFPSYGNSITAPMSPDGPTYVNGALAGDGTTFVGGHFTGKQDFDPGPGTDVHEVGQAGGNFVTKLGADGKYGWTRVFEGGEEGFIAAMSAGPGGSVVVAGSYAGTVDFDPGAGVDAHTSLGTYDPYVMKLLADGSLGWARVLVGSSDSSGGVQLSSAGSNGGVLIAGSYGGSLDLDPGPGQRTVSGLGGGTFVALLTPSGDLAWGYGISDCAQPILVALGPDGTARLGGQFTTECSFDPAGGAKVAPLGADVFVASFAPNGAYKGAKVFGGAHAQVDPASLTVGSDGAMILGGSFTGKVDFDPGSGTAERVSLGTTTTTGFLVATKADDGFAWVHTLPGNYVGGSTPIPGGGVLAMANRYDATDDTASRIMEFGSDGTSTWTLGFAPGNAISLAFIAADATGFSILGLLDGSADLDPGPGTHVFGRNGENFFFTSRYAL
jgi:hypothetical protein